MKILVYGAGAYSRKFVENFLNKNTVEILAFVESIKSKEEFMGFPVISGGV